MSAYRRLLEWLFRERWLIFLMLAALAVRLHWNLVVHPLGDFVYSDMHGYVTRANQAVDNPWRPREYSTFFPYGTHVFVAGLKLLFGREDFVGISVVYAIVGTLLVGFSYLVARRATRYVWVPRIAGLILVFYYPLISLGGYVLSEIPFATCLMASVFLTLRLIDDGRSRDAWLLGVAMSLGIVFRPQLMITAILFFGFWLAFRRHMPNFKFKFFLLAAVPIVLVLVFSSVRLHHNTGRFGLVSENAMLNLVFGRCHNSKILSTPDGKGHGKIHFRPPPFLQLINYENKFPDAMLKLDPIMGYELTYKGYIGDKRAHRWLIKQCLKRTTLAQQAKYSFTNVVLLWHYNVPWPDSSRPTWRRIGARWGRFHKRAFLLPALLGLAFIFRPRSSLRMGVVALNILAVLILAIVFFGGTRHRGPYDASIIVVAVEVYATIAVVVLHRVTKLVRAYAQKRASPD